MKTCSKCSIEKPITEFYSTRASCKSCEIKRRMKFRTDNIEKQRTAARKRYNPIKAKLSAEKIKQKDPNQFAEYARKYRNNNRETIRVRNRSFNNLRRSRVKKATPIWLSDNQKAIILSYYELARLLTIDTGTLHHVDHIEPINGINKCGLHVPWNLQVLTDKENLAKGNR